jgi:hypothetical protein
MHYSINDFLNMYTWSSSVIVEVFNAESPRVLEPEHAAHIVCKGRQVADTHTATGLAAGTGVAIELTCIVHTQSCNWKFRAYNIYELHTPTLWLTRDKEWGSEEKSE